uniref:Uncharacterized protein n=1 Tax=Rousettus aegyptiacus TaxID=9407 RepID=A0A7J8E8N3_ROUAE|nr:hypothetical protein HJG63_008170 [Rousettus aegyptiacus]
MTKKAGMYNGVKTVSSINGAGKIGQRHTKQNKTKQNKTKLCHFLTPYTRIDSKWIKVLNVRPQTIKLLEKNIGSILSDIATSNFFLDRSHWAGETKDKINKWNYVKLKSFTQQRKPTQNKKTIY